MLEKLILDPWTPATFKRAMGNRDSSGVSWTLPTWVGDHWRRLMAYSIYAAYYDNASRIFLNEADDDTRREHREYGDAASVIETILSSLLGEAQTLETEGAEKFVEEPDATLEEEGDEGEELTKRQAERKRNPRAVRQSKDLQDWFRAWAKSERLPMKLQENERTAVKCGDVVYVLGWNEEKGRVVVKGYDPGFYFPELDDDGDDFPSTVHLAWEREDRDGKRWVRRLTWRMTHIPLRLETMEEAAVRLGLPEGTGVIESRIGFRLQDGDRIDDRGVWRKLPWNEGKTRRTVLFSDGEWELGRDSGPSPEDFESYKAHWNEDEETGEELRDVDLGIDFLPLIHVPNTAPGADHYGQSSLSKILQILDDLSNTDTDLQAASATTGSPVIGVGGAVSEGKPSYIPGEVWYTGDGRLDMLDTSKSLDALLKLAEQLLKRLNQNSRVPEALMGRVKPSEVPSGIALALTFGPLTSLISGMRLVRDEKYDLMLKFIWRIALISGAKLPAWSPTHLRLGAYLPSDRSGIVNEVRELMIAHALSTETAVKLLISVGYPIDDAKLEVERIKRENFEAMKALAEATQGDADLVYRVYGLGSPPQPEEVEPDEGEEEV